MEIEDHFNLHMQDILRVREAVAKNGAEYPQHIPYSITETKKFFVAIENFGQTLENFNQGKSLKEKNDQISNKHVAEFYLNLLNLAVTEMV